MAQFVITAVNKGIGLALTKVALEEGHDVVGTIRSQPSEALRKILEVHGDRLQINELDLTSTESVERFSTELKSLAKVDVLVNNAGVYLKSDSQFDENTEDRIRESLATNLFGTLRVTEKLLPLLLESASGKVCSISSLMGSITDNKSGGSYGYRISKAALNMLNRSFAIDFPKLIAVVLHPGWVQTDMGGSGAPLLAERSAEGLMTVIEGLRKEDTGKFYDYKGAELPF
ncbi:MAG: hypothetical protein COT74_06780 [Bdellovibrionales bacterium CG10_big_fil_rev_8_21_14_0_10_45_34]|nr:MAG: hypothetical protein COT74_06780 [Bdellovibrionales bacterium CG10_big_fil_rev_8_21_14_0_10_45_34]